MAHKIYKSIIEAVEKEKLKEPFTKSDFINSCPGFGKGTYNAFLDKHSSGNPGGASPLFERVSPGKFKLIRPLKYGL